MKLRRMLAPIFALAMMMALTAAASAITSGAVYQQDESGRVTIEISEADGLVPGQTYAIALREAPASTGRPSSTVTNNLTALTNDMVTREANVIQSMDIVRRKTGPGANEYWWFIEVYFRPMTTGTYSTDGYTLKGNLKAGDIEASLDNWVLAYPEGTNKIRATPQFFAFNDEEAGIFLPDGRSFLIINSKEVESRLVLAMDTSRNEHLAGQYPDAQLAFFMGNGAAFPKDAVVAISGKPGDYLYEYNGGTLFDVSRHFNAKANSFTFKTKMLGCYIRSDRPLGQPAAPTPEAAQGGNQPAASVSTTNDALHDMVQKYFSNTFALASYGSRYEALDSAMPIRCKVDLSGLNTETLRIYAYNADSNNFTELTDHKASVDAEGYLYFNTPAKGRFVITDAPLTAR